MGGWVRLFVKLFDGMICLMCECSAGLVVRLPLSSSIILSMLKLCPTLTKTPLNYFFESHSSITS